MWAHSDHRFKALSVTPLGKQLSRRSAIFSYEFAYVQSRINFLQAWIAKQTQASNTKVRVEDVNHIPRSIRETTLIGILTVEYEICEFLLVDPMQSINHSHTAHDPPAIAHIDKLLRPAVQTTAVELSFAKPSTKTILARFAEEVVKLPGDLQCCDTSEDLSSVRLCSWICTKSSIEVLTSADVSYGGIDVNKRRLPRLLMRHQAQQRQCIESTIQETSVCLAPGVPSKCTIWLLQTGNISPDLVTAVREVMLKLFEAFEHGHDLHAVDGEEHVRVMMRRSTEASILMQTTQHIFQNLISR